MEPSRLPVLRRPKLGTNETSMMFDASLIRFIMSNFRRSAALTCSASDKLATSHAVPWSLTEMRNFFRISSADSWYCTSWLQRHDVQSARRRRKHCTLAVVRPSRNFSPRRTPFPGARDGQNLNSWRWSLPLPTDPVWWRSMHAISSYRGNRPTPHTHKYTGPITKHCVAASGRFVFSDVNKTKFLRPRPGPIFFGSQTGLVLRPTVSDHITGCLSD